MNFQHLQYIVEIENCGSLSRAARSLFVSQPYLSKILKEVEDEYQIVIFSRSKSGMIPTESGRLFLDMSKELLKNADNFQKVFDEHRDICRLRVSSCPLSHTMDAFLRMLTNIPESPLRFSYRETTTMDVVNDIHTANADIGLILLNSNTRNTILELLQLRHISCVPLFTSGAFLVVRSGHPLLSKTSPLTTEDLYQYNFVLYPDTRDAHTHLVESAYGDASLKLINWHRIRQVVYVYSRSSLHNILTRTDYIGLGTISALDQENSFGIVSIPLPSDIPRRDIRENENTLCCIFQDGHALSPAARMYLEYLKKYYGNIQEKQGL